MFRHLRIQVLYPCQTKCAWCATHRKNPLFAKLYRTGVSASLQDFYAEIIQHLRPKEVFISGGEPLLYPGIGSFLTEIQDSVERIHLFTSYQYRRAAREAILFDQLPQDKTILTHTLIYFDPERWPELTAGFPFEQYVENIRAVMKTPLRKCFKFIINHEDSAHEIERFQQVVQPNERCEARLKVVNVQGDGLNVAAIEQTRDRVRGHLDALAGSGMWGRVNLTAGSLWAMRPVLESRDTAHCPYRESPTELRFSFYRQDSDGNVVLKYRYCPYFPRRVGYRFHVGRDDPEKLTRNFARGNFRDHCDECRFLTYSSDLAQLESMA